MARARRDYDRRAVVAAAVIPRIVEPHAVIHADAAVDFAISVIGAGTERRGGTDCEPKE
jgi:hypothetical protein